MEDSRLVQGLVTLPRNSRTRTTEDQGTDEAVGLSPEDIDTGGVAENLRHLLPLVCVSDGKYSTSKRVRYLNDLAKVIRQADHIIEPNYPVERIIECARLSLLSTIKEVRAGGLRVLRYLLTSREAFIVMLKHCIDLLVARSLDAPPNKEIERLQAVRFVRQALTLCPQEFPRSLVCPLVAIVLQSDDPPDNLTWSSMATLCELALHNPELAARTGAIKALVYGLLKCHTSRISESVILTLSHLLNSPHSRKYICSQFDIESLLAPITDLHYCHQPSESTRGMTEQRNRKQRVESSKMALVSLLKSWPGIYCLCNQRNLGMTSLLNMLPLARMDVQREILDVLYGVFQLKVPEWTTSYSDAILSIDPAQSKSEWSLMEGFVAEEGNDLLPPKTVDRTNLIDCYQALLLAALMEEGLFHVLVETVRTASRHVTVMAAILMGELLHLTNVILPPGYSSNAHCLPDLIASAMDFHDLQDRRNRASEVISCLDRVHQLKKEEIKPSSLYLKLILDQSGYFSRKEEFNHIPSELDEATLGNLIKDTKVLLTKEYLSWDWRLLFSLLEHPNLKPTHINEDAVFSKFIKRLCNFYKPSNHLFSTIVYSEANSKIYSSVGQKLVKYLCRAEEGTTGYLTGLVSDMVMELGQVTASKLTADAFSSTSISHKLSRDYFLLLGTISFYKPVVLQQCKAYGPLLVICNYQNRSDLMKLIISSLDFAHDVHSQVILSKILTSTDQAMRLYATRHLRVLLRAKMPFFNSWGLEVLIPQLYDTDKEVAIEAADILDEACEEESFLKALVLQQPQLLHLGEKGAAIQTRFFSVKRGFALMSRLGYLDSLQERWSKSYKKLYVRIVEEKLAETLTSYKHTQDQEFIRRTNTNVINPKAFVPVHLYGQLAQHDEGCALLEKENYVPQLARVIRCDSSTVCSHSDIIDFKAAIWALGHIGSAVGGLELLIREGVVTDLVLLAEECPILSIRGTSYYALCLISKTSRGADILMEHNWTTVSHSLAEKWPLNIEEVLNVNDMTFMSPATTPATTPMKFGSPFPQINTPYQLNLPSPPHPLHTATPNKTQVTDPRKRGTQSVSTLLDSEHISSRSSRGFTKYHSSSTTEILRKHMPTNPASRYRLASNKNFKPHVPVRTSTCSRPTGFPQPLSQSRGNVHRPLSMTVSDMADYQSVRSNSSSRQSFGQGVRQSTNIPYLGVCLPLDIVKIFEYDEPSYEGFVTEVAAAPDFNKESIPHNPYKCLECSIPLNKAHHHSQSDISASNENLSSGATLGRSGSSSSFLELRSRSHTTESIISSSSSGSATTPHSHSSGKSGSKISSSGETAGDKIESEKVHVHRNGNRTGNGERNGMRSPLVRMKRVISEGSELDQHQQEVGSESDSSKLPSGSDGASGSGNGGKDKRGVEEEGGDTSSDSKGAQEVTINVIGASASVRNKAQQLKEGGGADKDTAETGSLSSISQSSSSMDGANKLHTAYLEVVYGLSSDVSLKKNTTTLNALSQKFPSLCQDVCLYSKVIDLLSTFRYNIATRRFIQSKFDKLNFSTIFAAGPQLDEEFSEDDFLSSACSSRRESFSSMDTATDSISTGSGSSGLRMHRRCSSTSDAAKFREKLQSLSQSVELNENQILVAESPREEEYEVNGEQTKGEVERSSKNQEDEVAAGEKSSKNQENKDISNSKMQGSNAQNERAGKDLKSNANNNSSAGRRELKSGNGEMMNGTHTKARQVQGMLNLTVANKSRDSSSGDMTGTSVLNVCFDL